MSSHKIALVASIIFITVACLGQNPVSKDNSERDTTMPKIFIGVSAALGNAPSPTSWAGLQLAVIKKYVEATLGAGWGAIPKVNIGLGAHTKLDKKFVPFVNVEYSVTSKKGFKFVDNGTERHYYLDYGHLFNYGIGLAYNPKIMTVRNYSVSGFFIKVGMRHPLYYSIRPEDPDNSYVEDIDKLYSVGFKTRLYVNVGMRVIAMHR
ncbi:MAG: hypothetical protein V4580_17550 [Bacteroidota bacterium]